MLRYSGVAWAVSNRPEQINIISNWNSRQVHEMDKEKAPTAIVYDENNEDVSSWGFSVPLTALPLKWFKLCLLDEGDLPAHVRDCSQIKAARSLLTDLNKHVTEVIADYLRELWAHALENIVHEVGHGFLEATKIQLVFTIPAIWPAYAQVRMKRAIECAGLLDPRPAGETTLMFINEPEAAALATVADMSGRADLHVRRVNPRLGFA